MGLCSPSSGTEIVYDSLKGAACALPITSDQETAARRVREKDIDEVFLESDEYDPSGKTPEQLDAMIAKYHRDVKASRMEAILHSPLGERYVPYPL